jgi:hypothetical protein
MTGKKFKLLRPRSDALLAQDRDLPNALVKEAPGQVLRAVDDRLSGRLAYGQIRPTSSCNTPCQP